MEDVAGEVAAASAAEGGHPWVLLHETRMALSWQQLPQGRRPSSRCAKLAAEDFV